MKCGSAAIECIHKDVVIIGNGPSGIVLSYMLSGNVPYVISTRHPDELLSVRLESMLGRSLLEANFQFLANGLEGRTTNPVSLLLDSLQHPCADIGLEMDALLEWRNDGRKFEKFGHKCYVYKPIDMDTLYPKMSTCYRVFNRMRMINETFALSYNFLRSHTKIVREQERMIKHPWMIHPFSDLRRYMEITLCIIMMFQCIMIPLDVAYHGAEIMPNYVHGYVFQFVRIFTDVLSMIALVLNFHCGYWDENRTAVILSRRKVILYYLSHSFLLDFYSSIPFDCILNVYEDVTISRGQTMYFILHYVGLIKLGRYAKLMEYVSRMVDSKVQEEYHVAHRIIVAILSFALYMHVITCCSISWSIYIFPVSERIAGAYNTIEVYGERPLDMYIVYARFYYSTCHLVFLAGHGFLPKWTPCLIFTANVWLCSFLIAIGCVCYFIKMTVTIRSSTNAYLDVQTDVHNYMQHRQLPSYLQKRILAFYDMKFENGYFHENDILNTVSGQLQQEIALHSCTKLIANVPFFRSLPSSVIARLVSCLIYDVFLTNDVIIKAATHSESMYFIFRGSVAMYTRSGKEIDHVVLGKGAPGGSWHCMDPEILTLSLGSWMSLPGIKFASCTGSEKRATARSVAEYYERYVTEMALTANFRNQVLVTKVQPYVESASGSKCEKWVEKLNNDECVKTTLCSRPERKEVARNRSYCLSNAFSYILNRAQARCAKRSWELHDAEVQDEVAMRKKRGDLDTFQMYCDKCKSNNGPTVPPSRLRDNAKCCDASRQTPKWIVEAVHLPSKTPLHFLCNHLVMANGVSDLPNKLNISKYKTEPYWLLHDLRCLEIELDLHLQEHSQPDPVLIVGAGLSAADAIIATKARNVPVVHVFRNQADITMQLPENMYPEYHKVHQMMKDGTTYPLYSSLPEYTLTNLDEYNHIAKLTSKDGKSIEMRVSFVVVLIGSRPDLSFLPDNYNLAVKKSMPIDSKRNTMSIDKLTHRITGYEGLYAIGPLSGDNFVRFLPGGAFAVLNDIRKQIDEG